MLESLVIATLLYAIPRLQQVLRRWFGSSEDSLYELSVLSLALEWGFLFLCTFLIINIIRVINAPIIVLVLSMLIVASLPTYDYLVYPFVLALRKGKMCSASDEIESWASYCYESEVKVRIYDGSLKNAYALGVISSSKLIILGKPLIENISKPHLRALIAHEVGHLRKNHILILYLSSLLCVSAFVLGMNSILAFKFPSMFAEGTAVFFGGAILSLILLVFFHQYLVVRTIECQADKYGANIVGFKTYVGALKEFDDLTDGKLSKGNPSHPPLSKRISNLESNQTQKDLKDY